jgi:hypothetical protein
MNSMILRNKGPRSLGIFKSKWSAKTEYFKLFLVCAFPIHVWAYISLLNDIPAMQLQVSILHILSIASYVLTFAFFESVFIFGLILLVFLFLPERLFELKLVHLVAILIITISISLSFIHLYDYWEIESLSFADWIVLWVLIGLFILITSLYLLTRTQRAQTILQSGIDRLAVLSLVYISLDILSLFVITGRNLIGSL